MRWCSSCGILGLIMNSCVRSLSRGYAAALESFLAAPDEKLLQFAYELGRGAAAGDVGVLDMARVHQQALAPWLGRALPGPEQARALKSAELFFLEALSPFEATHRGFREANQQLRRLNTALEQRNAELATVNRRLEQSGQHYRQLFHQARRLQEDLRSLSSQVLHAQEEERKRISRELHDEVGQALAAINMNLAMLQRNGASHGVVPKQSIADSLALVEQTLDTVHRFARELRPAILDDLGLLPALRSHVKGFAARAGWRLRFHGSAAVEGLTSDQKTVLFRVAQESLTNVAKHAQASRVSVTLRPVRNAVRLQINDNGRSFHVERQMSAGSRKRLGLLGMQERVRLVNGLLAVTSAPGKGTTVRVDIPLPAPERRSNHHA